MKVIGVIPARWGSTRFEAKVLAAIAGKPMIQHVWERAQESKLLTELIIACDDERIKLIAEQFGAKVVMTSVDHKSGTDRISEAIKTLKGDIVINIQGDEPLIHHSVIDDLANVLLNDQACLMATVVKLIEKKEDIDNPNVVKAVLDADRHALYFSRSPIPYNRKKDENIKYYKHLGLYAYRRDFLFKFIGLPKSSLEDAEQLEQLRVLEAGYKIKTVETNIETIGVDTREDLTRVEKFLSQK